LLIFTCRVLVIESQHRMGIELGFSGGEIADFAFDLWFIQATALLLLWRYDQRGLNARGL
jgi:hypothetical protein